MAVAALLGAACSGNAPPESGVEDAPEHHDDAHSHGGDDTLLPPPVASARVEHECVGPGEDQTLVVEAEPDDHVRYLASFSRPADDRDDLPSARGEGNADDRGAFTATFGVASDAVNGRATVAVFVRDAGGGYRGSTSTPFEISEDCPAARD